MLFLVALIFLCLWLLGLLSAVTAGGMVHVLLVVAIVVLILGLFNRRKFDE